MRKGEEQSGAPAPSERKVNDEEHHTGWDRAFAHLGQHVMSVFPTGLPAPCPLPTYPFQSPGPSGSAVTFTEAPQNHLRNPETVLEGRGLLGPQVLLLLF